MLPVGTECNRARWLGRLAGQEHRGAAGVGGRRYPGVDAGDGHGGAFAALEPLAKALEAFAAGGDEADDEQQRDQEAQRIRVAGGKPRRGHARAEPLEGREEALAMGEPQRVGCRIVGTGGETIGERTRRAVRRAGRLLDARQRFRAPRPCEARDTPQQVQRRERETGEDRIADRQGGDPPDAEPGDRRIEGRQNEERRDQRPGRFPQQVQPGAANAFSTRARALASRAVRTTPGSPSVAVSVIVAVRRLQSRLVTSVSQRLQPVPNHVLHAAGTVIMARLQGRPREILEVRRSPVLGRGGFRAKPAPCRIGIGPMKPPSAGGTTVPSRGEWARRLSHGATRSMPISAS